MTAPRQHLSLVAGVAGAALAAAGCGGPKGWKTDAGIDAGPGCRTNGDCALGEVCTAADGGPGRCGPCAKNGQCLPDQACSASHACAFLPGWGDQCTENGDCPLDQDCKQGLCAPLAQVTACIRNRCPSGQRCNQQNQVCEQDLGCFFNADCLPAQTCNPGTHACVPACTSQNAGQVCLPAQKCVNALCIDCASDADCGPGLTCNVAAGRCGGENACYSNADCPAGQVCSAETQACGDPPPPCASDDDCPPGESCDLPTGQCQSNACLPDVFDPNGSEATAAPIQAGETYTGLTLCNTDGGVEEDWFSIPLQSGDRIQVTINTDVTGSGYAFDVQLRAADGTILQDGNLVIDQEVSSSATYYLRMTDGDPQTNYGFGVLVSHGTPCPANPYEPNGSAVQAAQLQGGSIGPIWLCAGQQAWFVTSVPAGRSLTVTLGCDPTQGPLSLALFAGDGTTLLTRNDSGLPTETVSTANGGRVFVEVTGDGQDSNAYTLSLSFPNGG